MLLLRLIEAPARLRANIDTLNYFAVGLVMASAADAERREALAERLDIAMRSVGSADGFTIKDRLYAQRTRVELVKALNPDAPIPAAMIADVRETVAWADQAAETPHLGGHRPVLPDRRQIVGAGHARSRHAVTVGQRAEVWIVQPHVHGASVERAA